MEENMIDNKLENISKHFIKQALDGDEEKINYLAEVITEHSLVPIDEDEVKMLLTSETKILTPNQIKQLPYTIAYIKYRFVYKLSRYDAFAKAFPHRMGYNDDPKYQKFESISPFKRANDKPSKSTILIRAKRVEDSPLYKRIVAYMQSSLYITYAVDRMKVLDYTLNKIYDDNVKDRDKTNYIKIFLEETRKPEDKDIDINFEINNTTINMKSVENKLGDIANILAGKPANEIIDALSSTQAVE